MDDKELVEVWRKEFIDLSRLGSVAAIYERDRFLNREVELRWQGFLMAKRSQPIVKIDMISRYGTTDDILSCISAAGIKYTTGE